MNKSRPVLIIFSILAGLQVITAGTALADVGLPDAVAALIALIIAAVQVGMTFYVQNQVVPLGDTGAYIDQNGRMVAGPASPPSVLDGSSVEVVQHN